MSFSEASESPLSDHFFYIFFSDLHFDAYVSSVARVAFWPSAGTTPGHFRGPPPSAPVPSGVASSVPEQRPGVCPNAPERSRAPQSTPSILFWTLYNVGPGGWGLFVAALSCRVVYQGCAAVLTERELDDNLTYLCLTIYIDPSPMPPTFFGCPHFYKVS